VIAAPRSSVSRALENGSHDRISAVESPKHLVNGGGRCVLDPPGAVTSRLVANERASRLSLISDDSVDAWEFERSAAALGKKDGGRRVALLAAARLWGGEPLPEERSADWAIPWPERLIDRYAEVLAALIDCHARARDLVAAADVARQLVELDRSTRPPTAS
jgi:hypothetical protein